MSSFSLRNAAACFAASRSSIAVIFFCVFSTICAILSPVFSSIALIFSPAAPAPLARLLEPSFSA
jgi:hypothetical protein